jgi:hypothetical protein
MIQRGGQINIPDDKFDIKMLTVITDLNFPFVDNFFCLLQPAHLERYEELPTFPFMLRHLIYAFFFPLFTSAFAMKHVLPLLLTVYFFS